MFNTKKDNKIDDNLYIKQLISTLLNTRLQYNFNKQLKPKGKYEEKIR